jgi:hypothetical protein
MARKNPDVDYEYSLDVLRDLYVASSPKQRLTVIEQRLGYKDSCPNNLVNAVSAVEGFSRMLVTKLLEQKGDDLASTYKKYRFKNPIELIEKVMEIESISDLDAYFGEDTWELLKFAVNYRNLIVHECTYVGQDKAPSMIQACHDALVKLTPIAGITNYEPPF